MTLLRTCVACLALWVGPQSFAADWPQYRGPGGSGVAGGPAVVEFGPKKNLLWTAAVGSGHSSPSIWGESLFLTTFDATSQKLEVLAFDRRKRADPLAPTCSSGRDRKGACGE